MYTVRTISGQVLCRFPTKRAAENYVRGRRAYSPDRFASVVVFHGTDSTRAADIRTHGLVSDLGYNRPAWYMVASDKASAAHHAMGHAPEGSHAVLLEFHVPTELKTREDGSTKFMWPGFPYLWKAMAHSWEGQPSLWYALRQPLPPKFLKHVHRMHGD
jgi:hypothetical protein